MSPDAPFGWADVTTFDLAASAPFFERLFGWERVDVELPEAPGYSFLLGSGEVVAAIDPVPVEKGPPKWTVFVLVGDLAGALERIEAAGGSVRLRAEPIRDHGTLALARDPWGGEFGLWEPGLTRPVAAAAIAGALAGAELTTPYPEAAARFYREALGWVELDGEGALWLDAGVPAAIGAGEGPPAWIPWLGVADLAAARDLALELGASPVREGGPAPILAGPEGAGFGLRELAP